MDSTDNLFSISWVNSKGKELAITHLKPNEIAKFEEGFKSENKDYTVCPMK